MWGRELGDKGRIKEENRKNSYLFHCSEGWLHNTKFEWLSFPQNNLHFLQNHPHQVRQFLHSIHWSLKKRPKSWLILFKLRQVATKGLISLTIEGTQKWCGKTGDKRLWDIDIDHHILHWQTTLHAVLQFFQLIWQVCAVVNVTVEHPFSLQGNEINHCISLSFSSTCSDYSLWSGDLHRAIECQI